ncbi:hypothetical protein VTN96DRAFT_8928 [Rasamsonia emersonii]
MAMANPNAGTDTNRNENISNFNPPQRNQKTGLLEWPALPKIDVPLNSCEGQWLDHYPPSELRKIAIDCPEDVPRIVRQSLQKEQYILVVGSLVVEDADAAGPQSKEKKCSKDGDASSHLSRNSCAVSIRSEVSRHRKSFSGAKAWLTAKGKAGAGTGERGVRKLLRERAASAPEISECCSCFENTPTKQMVSLSCQHKYCTTCFLQLVETAMRVESLFPPKCCLTVIPLKAVLAPLTLEMKERYKAKAQEYAVSVSNRWYCPDAFCGVWIPPSKIKRHLAVQKCPRCHISICSVCRGRAHNRGDCPQESGLYETLEEAERQGWQRCYRCHAMVELTSGCRHITCKCKAEFCYVCGARWATCACTEDDMATRRAELAQRRTVREREAEQEAEIAAAIAAVEAMERREEEERIRREEQRRRREEEEARERKSQRVLEIAERMQLLKESLRTINQMQQNDLLNRQERQTQQLQAQNAARKSSLEKDGHDLIGHLEANRQSRMDSLLAAHAAELKRLQAANEEEENELIVKMTRLLKGCANVEEREMSILKRLRNTQKKDHDEMRARHQAEISDLKRKGSLELKSLQASLSARHEEQQKQESEAVRQLVQAAVIERIWFDRAVARREELLEAYRSELVSSGQAVGELVIVTGPEQVHV